MENKYFYYAVTDEIIMIKRNDQNMVYNKVVEIPCDYETAKKKAESKRYLINMINDLRR